MPVGLAFEGPFVHIGELAGFSELNPQIARDVRQTALAGPPMLHDRYPQDAGAVLGS